MKRVIRKKRRRRNTPEKPVHNSNSAEPRMRPRSGTWGLTFQMVTTNDPSKYAEITRYLGVEECTVNSSQY